MLNSGPFELRVVEEPLKGSAAYLTPWKSLIIEAKKLNDERRKSVSENRAKVGLMMALAIGVAILSLAVRRNIFA